MLNIGVYSDKIVRSEATRERNNQEDLWQNLKFRVLHATNKNSIFRPFVRLTNPRLSNGGLFHLCLFPLGMLDDSEVEINDVLGEGANITFMVRI